ncbi:MAG: aspartyl/asparaginyl beta-hydroxylase domain-containing protein [Alphaproteobacteria bacterium]|nr:MAG: aspartyl/asparaginyl beta-hydroxylase domain-containing protein [Alphaproteobacteria bacterium]
MRNSPPEFRRAGQTRPCKPATIPASARRAVSISPSTSGCRRSRSRTSISRCRTSSCAACPSCRWAARTRSRRSRCELKKSHDKIKADLQHLLSHHEEIPAMHEVQPRDLYVASRAWRTFLLKIWGHEIKENTAAVPDTYQAICRIPGVHTALFSILQGGAEITPHRGSAAGVIRFHYPLIVPKNPEDCWIEIGGHHFFWQEGEPLVFDDTREHWVKNQTEETRVVLIIDFDANMPFPVNLYTTLRYNLIRHSTEVKAVQERAAIGVPPRATSTPVASQGLISMASHTTVSTDRS